MRAPRALQYLLGLIAVAGFPATIAWVAPNTPAELIPSLPLSIAWAAPLLLLGRLRNPFSRVAGLVWVAWYFVGSVDVVASYYVYGKAFQMSVEQAGLIYLASTFVFLVGLLAAERIRVHGAPQGTAQSTVSPAIATDRFPFPLVGLLLVFPILYAWSMHRALGYFPILQGMDITQQIYELDYGRLYGYAVVLVFSMLLVVDRLSRARSHLQTAFNSVLLGALVFVSVLDGKRLTLMLSVLAAAAYLLRLTGSRLRRVSLVVVAGGVVTLAAALYVGVVVVRKGFQVEQYKLAAYLFSSIGDEYRDFVYSVNEFAPGKIPEYHWFTSGVFAGLNSALLAALGVSKHEEAIHGSAYVWQTLFGSNYGIRTGIVSELYFAYGWMSLWTVFAFGILCGWVSKKLEAAARRTSAMFLSSIYGILLLSVVGQTTLTMGAMSIVLYVYVLSLILRPVARITGATIATP